MNKYEAAQRKSQRILEGNNYRLVERCCATCKRFDAGYEGEAFCKLTEIEIDCALYIENVDYEGLCDKWEPQTGGKEEG